jgi:hypothetical protein
MSQKKHIEYAQAKGAPAGFVLQGMIVAAQSIARMVYSVSNSTATKHFLNADTGLVRIKALTNGVFVAFSGTADKAPARASGTLTSDETDVADGTEVVIGAITYRIVDTLEQAYDVQRDGSNADNTLASLAHAVSGTGTSGVDYHEDTEAHPLVTSSGVVSHVLTITAKYAGTAGNLALTSDDAHLTASAATLENGADGNFDEYIPAGQLVDIALEESVSELSLLGDGGTASVALVEY